MSRLLNVKEKINIEQDDEGVGAPHRRSSGFNRTVTIYVNKHGRWRPVTSFYFQDCPHEENTVQILCFTLGFFHSFCNESL